MAGLCLSCPLRLCTRVLYRKLGLCHGAVLPCRCGCPRQRVARWWRRWQQRFGLFASGRPPMRLGPAIRGRRQPWKRWQIPFPESLILRERAFQTQTSRMTRKSRKRGSPGKFVLSLGGADMTGMHGRHVIARDFRCVQELPFHQDGGQTRRRDCSGRAFGQTLCLPRLPQPGGDSQRQKNPSCANLADWLSSGLSGSRGAALPMQSVPARV